MDLEPTAITTSGRLPISVDRPSILCATGLRKAFGGKVVLDCVDLELFRGEVVLLHGENGSGKTTLLNILTGSLEPDAGKIRYSAGIASRAYRFPQTSWQSPWDAFLPEFVAAQGIGRTWQDIRLFRSLPLRDNIAVAAQDQPGENPLLAAFFPGRTRRSEAGIRGRAETLLARVGLKGRESSSADKVSLGQSKRVALIRAVATGAHALFLDEPLAGLDREGIADILAVLESLARERQLTLVIVEHVFNQPHLQGLVTTDWLLTNGRLECSAAPNPRRPIDEIRDPKLVVHPPWLPLITDNSARIVDQILPRRASITRIRHQSRFRPEAPPVLEVRNLVVKRGPRTVIGLDENGEPTGIDLTLHDGEIAILQAPNGWGKSTLFAALCGLIDIAKGEILLKGRPIQHLPPWERVRLGLHALPSDQHTFLNLTASETIRLSGNDEETADLGFLASRVCSSLSGGERQRVALASASSSDLQLLDEPFSSLDKDATRRATVLIQSGLFRSLLIAIPSLSRPTKGLANR